MVLGSWRCHKLNCFTCLAPLSYLALLANSGFTSKMIHDEEFLQGKLNLQSTKSCTRVEIGTLFVRITVGVRKVFCSGWVQLGF